MKRPPYWTRENSVVVMGGVGWGYLRAHRGRRKAERGVASATGHHVCQEDATGFDVKYSC